MRRASLIAVVAVGIVTSATTGARADLRILVANEPTGVISQIDASGHVTTFASDSQDRYTGLAVDSAGNVYAASHGNNLIREYNPSGANLGPFVSSGLNYPSGLAFDSSGNLYVANDTGSGPVSKFSSSGTPLGNFISGLPVQHIAFGPTGDFYASDTSSNTIRRYSSGGVFLNDVSQSVSGAAFMAFDTKGNLYVSAFAGNAIEEFTPTGALLKTITSPGLDGPTGLAFDPSGNLYVANAKNGTIREFSSSGLDLGAFATGLNGPQGLVIEASAVPEPSSLVMACIGSGLLGGYGMIRRQRRHGGPSR